MASPRTPAEMFEFVAEEPDPSDRRFLASIYEVLAEDAPEPIRADVETLHEALVDVAEGDEAAATRPDVVAAMPRVETWVDTHCPDIPE